MSRARVHMNHLTELTLFNDAATPVGSDISSQTRSLTLEMSADVRDRTTLGNSWARKGRGIKSGTIQIEFFVDFDVAGINSLFSDFWDNQEYVNFVVEDGNGEGYSGTFVMASWAPFNGAVDADNIASLTFELDGPVTAL